MPGLCGGKQVAEGAECKGVGEVLIVDNWSAIPEVSGYWVRSEKNISGTCDKAATLMGKTLQLLPDNGN